MKRLIPIAVVILLAAALSIVCCTPSVHPLYTGDDLIFEPALLGTWQSTAFEGDGEEYNEYWVFSNTNYEESGATPSFIGYTLNHTDSDGATGEFRARLLELDDHMFLDIHPNSDSDGSERSYLTYGTEVPTHMFMYVEQIEPDLRIKFLDSEWLNEFLEANPGAIGHEYMEIRDYDLLLTASTEELQAFVLTHLGEWAGEDAIVMERVLNSKQADTATLTEAGPQS